MWLFDLLDANERVTSTVPVVEGVHTLGRKGASISFPDDRSVSRKHAEVRVEAAGNDPAGQPIWVKDVGSKLKTFVNGNDTGEAQAEVALKDGDKVKVGTTGSVMRLRYQALRLCGTSLSPAEKAELKKLCRRCGGSVARRWEPGGRCTHLVSPAVATVTEKLVLAAAEGRPAVHVGWLGELAAAGAARPLRPVPDTAPFVSVVKRGRGSFPVRIDAERRTHLAGEFLIALYKEEVVEKMVETTGGSLCRAYAMSDGDFAGQDWQNWAAGRKSHFVQPVEGQPLITPQQGAMVDSRGAILERLGIEATNKQQLAEAVLFLQPLISVAEAAAMQANTNSSAVVMGASASEAWGPSQSAASQVPQAPSASHARRPAAAAAVSTDPAMPPPPATGGGSSSSNSRAPPKPTGVDGVDADADADASADGPTSRSKSKNKDKPVLDGARMDGEDGGARLADGGGGDGDGRAGGVSREQTESAAAAAAAPGEKTTARKKKRGRQEQQEEEGKEEEDEGKPEEVEQARGVGAGATTTAAVGAWGKEDNPRSREEAGATKGDSAVAGSDAKDAEEVAGGSAKKGDGSGNRGGGGGDPGTAGSESGEGGERPTKRRRDAPRQRRRGGEEEEHGGGSGASAATATATATAQGQGQGEEGQQEKEEGDAVEGKTQDEAAETEGRRGRGRDSQRSGSSAPAPAPAPTVAPGGWMTAHNAASSQKEKRRKGGAGAGVGGGARSGTQGGRGRGGGGAEDDAKQQQQQHAGGGEEEEDEGEEKARLEAPLEAAVTEKCRLVVRAYSRAAAPKGYSGTSARAGGGGGRRGALLPNFKRFKKNTIMYGGEMMDGYVPLAALRSTLPKESERELVLAAEQQRLEEEEADADRLFTQQDGNARGIKSRAPRGRTKRR